MSNDKGRIVIEDKKREYLIKTLSRTKRKDYENYIINRIYHKLNRLDVQPVTQQYMKRSDGRYALIDLYFPQIHYGVECDESYHLNQHESDMIRTLTIEEMLDSVEETQGFILRRVKVYESLDSIERQINEIVEEIKSLLKEHSIKAWKLNEDVATLSIQKRLIRVEDHLEFDKITSIAKCFGKNYKGYQRSGILLDRGYSVWCPKLAIMIEGKAKPIVNGWLNTLSNDWNYIYEENPEKGDIRYAIGDPEHHRIIFAKSKNNLGQNYYRFIGVFKYEEKLSSPNKNVYARVATSIDLTPWLDGKVMRRRMTKTLEYYNQCAQVYNETTLNIEFDKKREFLLKYLKPKAHILDLGCGSGRDSKAFLQQGYEVTAMDGSQALCKIASENIGREVRCQLFHELADIETYEGIWACASLLHLPTVELRETLKKVARALKNDGYFYASFKYGEFEGDREGRFFNDFTEDSFKSLLTEIPNLTIIETEVTTDVIPGRENVSWLNIIMKKSI